MNTYKLYNFNRRNKVTDPSNIIKLTIRLRSLIVMYDHYTTDCTLNEQISYIMKFYVW